MVKMSVDVRTTNQYDRQALKGSRAGHLFQRYRPQRELGRGPMATVYRVVDDESGLPAALKLFDARFRHEPRFAIRFRQHLKAVVGLNHDHLVNIRDYGLAGDHFYIVAELVDGQNLATLMAERGALSPAAAAEIARQACLGLAAAHEQGLVHRNLKPENILLSESGQVKVADVGLSGLLSESGLSRTSVMLHGAVYMAPEQGRGLVTGPAADIYSLGVILFEMVTGRPPFDSADVWSIVQMHLQADPPSPRSLNSDIPPQLAAVIVQALRKEPDQRIVTAGEMAAALASSAGGLEVFLALPPEAAGRRRLPAAGSRLGLLFVASFSIIFLLLWALSGLVASDSMVAASDGKAQYRSIVKPLPTATTVTATPIPTSTPTTEPTPTVAAETPKPLQALHSSPTDSGSPTGRSGSYDVTESNQNLTLTCNGHSAVISGSGNTITLLGSCGSIVVRGNANMVFYQVAASITNTGNNNSIQQR